MQRTPEPELMDDAAQALAYAQADFSATDAAFVADCVARFGPLQGRAIDLGCGPGNISLRLAAAAPALEVLGVDGAAHMIALARAAATDAAPARFAVHTLPDPTLPTGFDLVVSNSLLHHLHTPAVLWQTIRAVGRPGAAVMVGDLRRPADEAAAQAIVERYAAEAPPVLTVDFYNSLRAAFEPDEVRAQLAEAGLGALTVSVTTDRHLLVWGRLPG